MAGNTLFFVTLQHCTPECSWGCRIRRCWTSNHLDSQPQSSTTPKYPYFATFKWVYNMPHEDLLLHHILRGYYQIIHSWFWLAHFFLWSKFSCCLILMVIYYLTEFSHSIISINFLWAYLPRFVWQSSYFKCLVNLFYVSLALYSLQTKLVFFYYNPLLNVSSW